MNEKAKEIMAKVDQFTDKFQFFPKFLDKGVSLLKHPAVASVPGVISKLASRFSGIAMALFSVIFALYCLKNAVICMFFEDAPVGLSVGYALASLISIALNCYLIYKTDGIFDKIISTSQCRISSLNIFSILSFLFVFIAVFAFFYFLYEGINIESAEMIIIAVVSLLFFLLLAFFTSSPEDFAIVEDENASAGEDFTAVCTFSIKLVLRLIPIVVFVLPIIGICCCIPEIADTYTETVGDMLIIDADQLVYEMSDLAWYLLIGLIPLLAYFYYLTSYVALDFIRAVLSLPRKLDDLKK